MRIIKLDEASKNNLLKTLLKRSPNNYKEYEIQVSRILEEVREKKDKALFGFTKDFDKAIINETTILVTDEEMREAYSLVNENLINIIRKAIVNIRLFHEKQKQNSWFDSSKPGVILGQKVTPISRVGVYVPGGKAAYPSSVLMNIIPAKIAEVDEIIMTTPPSKDGKINPGTLVAAKEAGVDKIYKVGGAQAIAAMAYGTESIKKVDKIVGPGNIYV
ncbi:MAG: histidinol dehydrogenase, partial [Clostridiales bacterium]|nr:histidinol dehydrogenase [Clostridiales bacterium]